MYHIFYHLVYFYFIMNFIILLTINVIYLINIYTTGLTSGAYDSRLCSLQFSFFSSFFF